MKQVINRLFKNSIDGIIITNEKNVRYFSKFKGEDSFLFLTKEDKYLITDARYTEQGEQECPDFTILDWKYYGNKIEVLKTLYKKHNIKNIGIEFKNITIDFYNNLEKLHGVEYVEIDPEIVKLRSIKSDEEIEYSRKACEIACKAFDRILKDIKIGVTEKDLSNKLQYYLKLEGSTARCYENIFISGSRTSLLHGIPSNRTIQEGDLVLLDFGAGYNGYLSDMTRTLVVGDMSSEQKEVYNLVNECFENGLKAIRKGVKGKDVYNASIEALKSTKYFKYYYSGIGHGVGLDIHEAPFLGPASDYVLEENNVITLEPGIYIPGWGGVRIEDQVIVTRTGCENLITSTREIIKIPV